MGSLQFPNMGMGLRLAAFGRRSSAINVLRHINIFILRAKISLNAVNCIIRYNISW